MGAFRAGQMPFGARLSWLDSGRAMLTAIKRAKTGYPQRCALFRGALTLTGRRCACEAPSICAASINSGYWRTGKDSNLHAPCMVGSTSPFGSPVLIEQYFAAIRS